MKPPTIVRGLLRFPPSGREQSPSHSIHQSTPFPADQSLPRAAGCAIVPPSSRRVGGARRCGRFRGTLCPHPAGASWFSRLRRPCPCAIGPFFLTCNGRPSGISSTTKPPTGWCSTDKATSAPTDDADYAVWPQPGWGSSPSRWRAPPPFRLLPVAAAARRVAAGLRTVLDRLPHDQGVLPHFVDSDTFAVYGADVCSTIETGWIAAGALWAAAFLNDPLLEALANRLYGRIDWRRWAAPNGLLRHGKGADGASSPAPGTGSTAKQCSSTFWRPGPRKAAPFRLPVGSASEA